MDTDREKSEELRVDDEEEERDGEEEEEEDEGEEEDAKIFNTWMLRYRAGERQEKPEKEEAQEEEPQTEQPDSRSCMEPLMRMRTDRRASLPCPVREYSKST